jgi:hypothetical protein
MVCVNLSTDFMVELTIDCGLVPPPDGGGEGCTPGFWKNRGRRIGAWDLTPYALHDNYDLTFGTAVFGSSTLLEVIRNRPDVGVPHDLYKALGRHSVAAVLNASHPDVDYDMSAADVIALTASAFASNDLGVIEDAKDTLADFNEQGSDLCN